MAPTRLTARLFAEAERPGAKVVAVGDPGRLGSVQAGGWLAAITATDERTPTLREVIRQQDASERDALQALHDEDPDGYVEREQDEITVHHSEPDGIAKLVGEWDLARGAQPESSCARIGGRAPVGQRLLFKREQIRDENRELASSAQGARLTCGTPVRPGMAMSSEPVPGKREADISGQPARARRPLSDATRRVLWSPRCGKFAVVSHLCESCGCVLEGAVAHRRFASGRDQRDPVCGRYSGDRRCRSRYRHDRSRARPNR